jgi:hypothetical protein
MRKAAIALEEWGTCAEIAAQAIDAKAEGPLWRA